MSLVDSALLSVGVVIFLLVYSVRRIDGGSYRSAISRLGINRRGAGRSILWALVFMLPILAFLALWLPLMTALFGNAFATAETQASTIPRWYAGGLIIYLVFNAIMEEALGRGFMLERLMPSHPGTLRASFPAILGVSALGMLYHVPTYVLASHFSPVSLLFNLVFVFVCFTFVGLAYVRSRVSNISGPILVHFLLDAVPYFLLVL